ncbi:hypothetical protein JOC34_001123 [Virgibacillus halotolerans]|uniref:S1C family serine protease n=1 Tax=Virgibacillus halotolerans TaxID=1071053 RepID=UPI00195F9D0D|nr:trypsin-like peptidase domain-containing protein [Virgibacillus halotolerans]MBM7598766.1 hypothetical protein [Virgibacillus halotolerans]
MHKKQLFPIITSLCIVIIGVTGLIFMYDKWHTQDIPMTKPAINHVSESLQAVDLKSIIHEAEKNVIQIEGQNQDSVITGSGFLYNQKGDIVTNAHVIEDADVIYVRTSNAQTYPAAVVGIGDGVDIAVIRVPQLADQTILPIEKENSSEIGDEIIALGSPHGFQNTVTLGIISGTDRNFAIDGYDYNSVYQISAQITHGNSGGPLINRETGAIIGVNSVGTEDGTIGFSIPMSEVVDQVEQWSNEAQNDQLDFASTSDMIHTPDPEQFKEDALYMIDYYLTSIDIRDYVNAYTVLSSSIQSNLTYSTFRDNSIDILGLTYKNLQANDVEDNQLQASAEVTIEKREGNKKEVSKSTSKLEFTIGYENDQLKILKMSDPKK